MSSPSIEATESICDQQIRNMAQNMAVEMIRHSLEAGSLALVKPANGPKRAPKTFSPRMDIYSDPAVPYNMAVFELPGVWYNEVSITLQSGTLLVEGERRMHYTSMLGLHPTKADPRPTLMRIADTPLTNEDDSKDASMSPTKPFLRNELYYGAFQRRIPLPLGTQPSEVTARMQDGMLLIYWPRRDPARAFTRGAIPDEKDLLVKESIPLVQF